MCNADASWARSTGSQNQMSLAQAFIHALSKSKPSARFPAGSFYSHFPPVLSLFFTAKVKLKFFLRFLKENQMFTHGIRKCARLCQKWVEVVDDKRECHATATWKFSNWTSEIPYFNLWTVCLLVVSSNVDLSLISPANSSFFLLPSLSLDRPGKRESSCWFKQGILPPFLLPWHMP